MAFDPAAVSGNVADAFNIAVRDAILFIPNLLEAIVLLLLGYFISALIGRVISGLLDYLRVEEVLQKYRVEDALGGNEVSPILATVAKWYVMLLFLTAAIEVLNLSSINWFIAAALLFAPVLIGVGLLIIVAAIIGEWLREAILDLHKFYMQKTIAEVLKWAIVIVSVIVALETVGFQMGIVREVFAIVLQGIVYGVTIAFGLAFGLGGQKDATDLIKKVRRKLKF
ncbi:MAG: hypothetical protein ABIH83_05190 [Candidatus Micrarchaeota archaeon]